jgi:transcriptional regulator with XRE-family HTH domain
MFIGLLVHQARFAVKSTMPETINDLEAELTRLGSRLKTLRAERGWTLEDLSTRADLSQPYLSRLEAGERQPSLAALISLAQAFEMPLATLFETGKAESKASNVTVTRAGTRSRRTGNELDYVALTGGERPSHLNAVLLNIPARRANTDMNHHDSEELMYVLEGRVVLHVDTESIALEVGDSAHYDARLPHRADAIGRAARVLLVASTAPKSEFEINH